MTIEWGREHFSEIRDGVASAMQRPDKDEITKRLEKCESYDLTVLAPVR
jgi:hypothetical protein